ncbi:MAG: hypothetical protein K1000chlam2_00757 [Chlamydiae bacterium]|nr:hypothetical protein [Chlamydiota bacterium]
MTSKLWLLAICPALLAAEEPPMCESYTPGQLCLCDGWGISLIGDGLYWTAREHHLIITTANAGFDPTDQVPPNLGRWNFQGDMLRIEPSWDYGWRAGLGFTSPCDYWDLFSYWTSFRTDASEEIDIIELPGLNLWGYPDTSNASLLFAASANWDLKYDVFDAEFGRAFWIGRCLVFRPHFGVRAAWIDQTLDFNFDYQPQNGIPFGALKHFICDFTGAGLRSGFDLNFTNGTGFSLYGKTSLSLLYGSFQSDFSETETGDFLIADAKDRFQMGVIGFQGMLGVNWNRCFCCDRFRLGLHVQWEFNLWNDVNKFNHYSTPFSNGIFRQENTSLALMGLTFGGGVDF